MTEITVDAHLGRYAARTQGMTASEIRALFAVASRPEVVSLAGGMPYTAALDSAAVADVTARVLLELGPVALQYGDGQGLPELRDQLTGVMQAEGVPGHADDLVVTNGGQQGLDLVAKLLCDPGDVVLAEGPSYVGALGAFAAYQAEVVHVPLDAQGLDPQAVEDRLQALERAGRRVKLLYTVPNHQNPAGVCMATGRREELVEVARRYDVLIVEDNPYGLLSFKGEIWPSLRSLGPERVIYLGTLSKIFSPGIRTGWVAAPGPIRDRLVLLKEAADLCQSNLTQYVAQRWLATQPWMQQVERFRDVYRERCEAMLAALEADAPAGCSWRPPEGGFFVWLRLPAQLDAAALLPKALGARVAFVPGRAFYADGSGRTEMRLSYCYPAVDRIREGISRLGRLIAEEEQLLDAFGGRGQQ